MKCISLWQPWATLWALGAKRMETRHWDTRHRGPLLIHSAKKRDRDALLLCVTNPFFKNALKAGGFDFYDQLPFGQIVGRCDLVTTWPTEHLDVLTHNNQPVLTEQEEAFGNYGSERFAWLSDKNRHFSAPIPFKGFQQLFNVPDDLVAEQLAKAGAL